MLFDTDVTCTTTTPASQGSGEKMEKRQSDTPQD